MNSKNTKKLTVLSMFLVILFVTEYLLAGIPNIQLTVLLLVLFSRYIGPKNTIMIIFLHVSIKVFVVGLPPTMAPFMILGWIWIPLMVDTFKTDSEYKLAILGSVGALLFSWTMILHSALILPLIITSYEFSFTLYFMADIPFEILLVMSSTISILFLYRPLSKVLKEVLDIDGLF